MQRFLTSCFAILTALFVNAQSAQQTLDAFFARLDHETLTGSFSANSQDSHGSPSTSYRGFIEMRGEVFHARIWDTELSYDGVTLATYNDDANELTLTYPTPEELQQGNPMLFAKSMAEFCRVDYAPSQPQGMYMLVLTPKVAGSEIVSISLLLRKTDLLPSTIVLRETNMNTTTLKLEQQQWSQIAPVTTIPTQTANKEKPFINDLR